MPVICNDFTYNNKSLSDFQLHTVNFDGSDELPLFLRRSIIKGETNRYKFRANHISATWDDVIELEFHLIKCDASEFTKQEVREITRWLTATSVPISFKTINGTSHTNYCGVFTDVDTFSVGNRIHGIIATFTNDSPFSYSDEIISSFNVSNHTIQNITNDSDLLDDYCYPTVQLTPRNNTDFYMVNLSDCNILNQGTITITGNSGENLDRLLDKIELYGAMHNYNVDFYYDSNNKYITLANNSAIRFKYIDKYGNDHYCFAYYQSNNYTILEGGFFILKLLKLLPVTIDCELFTMVDDIGRMILFEQVGIQDEDYIYWPRLKWGDNNLLFFADNCDIKVTHVEMIKGGVL